MKSHLAGKDLYRYQRKSGPAARTCAGLGWRPLQLCLCPCSCRCKPGQWLWSQKSSSRWGAEKLELAAVSQGRVCVTHCCFPELSPIDMAEDKSLGFMQSDCSHSKIRKQFLPLGAVCLLLWGREAWRRA